MSQSTLLDRLRRPEYTGQNRCRPCTILNLVVIAAVGAVVVLWNLFVAALVVAAGLVVLALRGYVVPGTPRFAPRLADRLPFDFGHTEPPRETEALSDTDDGTDGPDSQAVLESLVEAGVIESDGEQLFLNDAFRETWTDHMASLRAADDSELLARIDAAAPADFEVQLHDDLVLLAGGRDVWVRRAVAIAETAAVETLEDWDLPADVRVHAAQPLRNFLETCPACGGEVRESTRKNCCGGPGSVYENPEQPVLACADCGTVVIEL